MFLVGSAMITRDYRDVDVRIILDNDEFKEKFGHDAPLYSRYWRLTCLMMSEYLAKHSNLPVDFQYQPRRKIGEEEKKKPMHSLGVTMTTKATEF